MALSDPLLPRPDCESAARDFEDAARDLRERAAKVLLHRYDDVNDAMQETYVRVMEACAQGRIRGPVRNFAFGVLAHVAYGILEQSSRFEPFIEESAGAPADGPGSAQGAGGPALVLVPGGRDDADDDGRREALTECLASLSADRRAFILRYSTSHGEGTAIAAENRETPNAVHVRAWHIRKQLRRCIDRKLAPRKDPRPRTTLR